MPACWYWILKTKAQCLFKGNAEALAAADKAKALLWTAFGETMLLDCFYYTGHLSTQENLDHAAEKAQLCVGRGSGRARASHRSCAPGGLP